MLHDITIHVLKEISLTIILVHQEKERRRALIWGFSPLHKNFRQETMEAQRFPHHFNGAIFIFATKRQCLLRHVNHFANKR